HKAHWHGRVTKLLDGRLFALLWTQDARTGQFIQLHRIVSDVSGREWEIPQATNVAGETSWAGDLGQGCLVAAYTVRQAQPPGIRATWSEDGGQTWNPRGELVLWDATGRERIGVAAKDTYPVSHDVIAYGRPQAIRAGTGDVLVSFWCTEA